MNACPSCVCELVLIRYQAVLIIMHGFRGKLQLALLVFNDLISGLELD